MTEGLSALREEDYLKVHAIITKLHSEISAKVTSLIDKDGRQIAVEGETQNLDIVSIACLTAGNIAAADGLARLLGEKEFSGVFHEGEHDNIHISVVSKRAILIIIFDQRSSLGLVRLRVRKALVELDAVIKALIAKEETRRDSYNPPADSPFAKVTEEDIERLFRRF